MLSGLRQFIVWKDESLKGSGCSGCPRCSYVAVQVALCRGPSRKLNSAPQSLSHLACCIVLFSFLRLLFWFPFNFVNVFLRTEKNILPSKFVCLKYCVRSQYKVEAWIPPILWPERVYIILSRTGGLPLGFFFLPSWETAVNAECCFWVPGRSFYHLTSCHCGPSRALLLSEAVGWCSGVRCFNWVQSHVGPIGVL